MKISLNALVAAAVSSIVFAGLSGASVAADVPTVRIGTLGGPYEQVTEAAAKAGPRNGVKIVPVVFDGIVSPNEALVGGDIDGNAYQHIVFLNSEVANRKYKLIKAADIYTVPLAIYSTKHKTLADIPVGGKFAIPADEANQSRALLALQDNGLIKLRPDFNPLKGNASVLDVVANPKKLQLIEISTTILANSLPDVDGGAVNANLAYQLAKLSLKDALAVENKETTKRYTQVLVIREADKNKPWVAALVKSYQSDEVRQLIDAKFKNVMTPAF